MDHYYPFYSYGINHEPLDFPQRVNQQIKRAIFNRKLLVITRKIHPFWMGKSPISMAIFKLLIW